MPRLIGLLGGSFDPPHHGHIRLAVEVYEQLNLEQIRLIPVNQPAHKTAPIASVHCRLEMLTLAIDQYPQFQLELAEIDSTEKSYTINTLRTLRQKFEQDSLCLIVGRDAFNTIHSWEQWQSLLDYCHIIVANRPDTISETIKKVMTPKLKNWIKQHQITTPHLLKEKTNGCLYFIDLPPLAVSSSMIRARLAQQQNIHALLPETVHSYIIQKHLYTNHHHLINIIMDTLKDHKATDIVMFDVSKLTDMTNHIMIASGTSKRQINALAEKISVSIKEQGVMPISIEGMKDSEWVLIDLGDIIIHIMHPDMREYYQLEKLWSGQPLNQATSA